MNLRESSTLKLLAPIIPVKKKSLKEKNLILPLEIAMIFQLLTLLCYTQSAPLVKRAEVVDTEASCLIIYRSVRKLEHPIVRN